MIDFANTTLAIKEVILEKQDLHCTHLVDISVKPYDVAMMLIYDMRSYILSEQLDRVYHKVEYPSDWWQAFKERWFSKRMLKRWPVKKKVYVVDIDFKALYPELTAKVSIPDSQSILKYVVRTDNFPMMAGYVPPRV